MLDNRRTERHEMILQDTHEGGAEEWYCPICGRRFLMQWPPNFKRIVLEGGDENAIHTGSKGGVHAQADIAPADQPQLSDEWQTALAELNFGMTDAYDDTTFDEDIPDCDYDEPGLSDEMIAALDELDFSALDSVGDYDEEE